MRTLRILSFILFLLSSMKVISQNEFTAHLYDIRMVSDSVSRYSEPKISPDGTKILTARNLDTLIYINLNDNSEVELQTGGYYHMYYWIDNNQIYYRQNSEINSVVGVEIGTLTLNPARADL